jgi:glycogen synthase kinase 3 beta
VGVVFTELLLGKPLFHGQSCIDQLVLIISKLGTPTKDQIQELNHNYVKYDLPQIKPRPLQSLFPPKTPSEAIDLMLKIFEYKPSLRIGALHACAHSLFDELREPGKKWAPDPFAKPRDLPPLFDFTEHELSIEPSLNSILVPNHYQRLIGDGSATAPHI